MFFKDRLGLQVGIVPIPPSAIIAAPHAVDRYRLETLIANVDRPNQDDAAQAVDQESAIRLPTNCL
jgi:hypothetical protein